MNDNVQPQDSLLEDKNVSTDGEEGINNQANEPFEEQVQSDSADDQSNLDEKYEKEEWAKKRIDRLERRHKREMQELVQNMQNQFMQNLKQMQNPQQAQWSSAPQAEPTDIPAGTVKDVQTAVQQVLEQQEMQKQLAVEQQKNLEFANREKKLENKYDDYFDVISDVKPYLSREIVLALRELPEDSLENFYLAWKKDPEEIKKISKMSPLRQPMEIARLDAKLAAKNLQSQSSQSRQTEQEQMVRPVRPSGSISGKKINEDLPNMVSNLLSARRK